MARELVARKKPTKAQLAVAIKVGLEECFKREIYEAFVRRSNREPTPYPAWEEISDEWRKRKLKRYGFDRIGVVSEELLKAVEGCKVSYEGNQLRIQIPSDHYSKFAKVRPVVVTPTAEVLSRYIASALQTILS